MPSNVITDFVTINVVDSWLKAKENLFTFLGWLSPFSTIFSLLLIVGIVYCFMRIEEIVHKTRHEDKPHGDKGHDDGESDAEGTQSPSQKRWERIVAHANSVEESNWRLAILEADVLLDEMVTHMGYHGDSLGEKLKGVEKSDFVSLDMAWEAHAVRNKIAHEGAAFALTEREAKRVIGLYENVFSEFHYL